jgi:hypothetical protein
VNGLVAYGYRRYPKALFGPYFGDAVGDLFACASDGDCRPRTIQRVIG